MTDSIALQTLVRLNEPAPESTAQSTHGELKLTDFRGKWAGSGTVDLYFPKALTA